MRRAENTFARRAFNLGKGNWMAFTVDEQFAGSKDKPVY